VPIQENFLYPGQTNLNADPVSLDPPALRHIVRNTNALTKAHLITISGAPNRHPGSEILSFPPRSEFVDSALPIGSSYRGSRSTSHDTLCQPTEIHVLDPMPSGSPSQPQSQSEPDPINPPSGGTTPPVGHLYAQIKEHAGFMVGLVSLLSLSFLGCVIYYTKSKSGVLVGVAFNAACSDKTKGHPRVCCALSALRIYSVLLNLAALTTLALLLFIPQNGRHNLSSQYLWLLCECYLNLDD
jgi:hypothetical protein